MWTATAQLDMDVKPWEIVGDKPGYRPDEWSALVNEQNKRADAELRAAEEARRGA